MVEKPHVGIRLPSDVKDALTRAAADDGRSVSSLIERIVTPWLKKGGWLEAPVRKAANVKGKTNG
jgi:hypothetical protein